MTVRTEQLRRTQRNLKREIAKIEGVTTAGLLAAGFVIFRDSQKRVPVEHGNLRASGFVQRHPTRKSVVEIGYGAAYAFFVHENTEEKLRGQPRPSGLGTYWNPGESKFLEKALIAMKRDALKQVRRHVKKHLRG